MHQEIASKWVEALRHGEYGQTYGYLREEFEEGKFAYCVLGVLCDIHTKETGEQWFPTANIGTLPNPVMLWAGMHHTNPDICITLADGTQGFTSMTDANDQYGVDFATFANLIERQADDL
jgi:hypothetical protein